MKSPSVDLGPGGQGGPRWRRVPWEGEVDIFLAPDMLARVVEGAGADHVVVDLSAVRFMDAAGLGALVKARSALRARDGEVFVSNPPAMVRWMLSYFGLTDMIEPEDEVRQRGPVSEPATRAQYSSCKRPMSVPLQSPTSPSERAV